MSTATKRRLLRDFKKMKEDPPKGCTGIPHPDNIQDWDAYIIGPEDSPFEGGTFRLTLSFDDTYPNKPPKVKFVTKMFHPNIYADGGICLDILQNQWSPIYDVSAILTSIQSLLCDPNPNSPANGEAAKLYQDEKNNFQEKLSIDDPTKQDRISTFLETRQQQKSHLINDILNGICKDSSLSSK